MVFNYAELALSCEFKSPIYEFFKEFDNLEYIYIYIYIRNKTYL